MQGRGRFYEEVGAIRDVVENHLLEIVALLTMEPPSRDHPDCAARREAERVRRDAADRARESSFADSSAGTGKRPASRRIPTSRRSQPFACTSTRIAGAESALLHPGRKELPVTRNRDSRRVQDAGAPPVRRVRGPQRQLTSDFVSVPKSRFQSAPARSCRAKR